MPREKHYNAQRLIIRRKSLLTLFIEWIIFINIGINKDFSSLGIFESTQEGYAKLVSSSSHLGYKFHTL